MFSLAECAEGSNPTHPPRMHGVFRRNASCSLANLQGSLPPLTPSLASACSAWPTRRAPPAARRSPRDDPPFTPPTLEKITETHLKPTAYVKKLLLAEEEIPRDDSNVHRDRPRTPQGRPGPPKGNSRHAQEPKEPLAPHYFKLSIIKFTALIIKLDLDNCLTPEVQHSTEFNCS